MMKTPGTIIPVAVLSTALLLACATDRSARPNRESGGRRPVVRIEGSRVARCGQVLPIARAASRVYRVELEVLLAVMRVESNFRPAARSHKGAMGLMQLMPRTARKLGVRRPYDPYQNIMGGAKLLRRCQDLFGGSLVYALAAYNAGPGTMGKYYRARRSPPNMRYVRKVLHFRDKIVSSGCRF